MPMMTTLCVKAIGQLGNGIKAGKRLQTGPHLDCWRQLSSRCQFDWWLTSGYLDCFDTVAQHSIVYTTISTPTTCVTKATRLRHHSQLGAVCHWRLAVVHWKCATAQSHEDRGSDLWNKPAAKTSSQYTRRLGRRSPRQVLRRRQAPWVLNTRHSTDVRQTHHERYSLLSLPHMCTAPYSSATNSWYC